MMYSLTQAFLRVGLKSICKHNVYTFVHTLAYGDKVEMRENCSSVLLVEYLKQNSNSAQCLNQSG